MTVIPANGTTAAEMMAAFQSVDINHALLLRSPPAEGLRIKGFTETSDYLTMFGCESAPLPFQFMLCAGFQEMVCQ